MWKRRRGTFSRAAARCPSTPRLSLIHIWDPDRKLIPRPAPDLPAPGEQAARNVRALGALGLHRAGNEELTRRNGAALPHHCPAVVSAHLGDEGVALRDDVRGRAVIRQLGLGHAVAHADVGTAAADVDRQPRKLGPHSITAAPMTYRDQGRSVGRNRFKSPQHRATDTSMAVSRMAASRLEAEMCIRDSHGSIFRNRFSEAAFSPPDFFPS